MENVTDGLKDVIQQKLDAEDDARTHMGACQIWFILARQTWVYNPEPSATNGGGQWFRFVLLCRRRKIRSRKHASAIAMTSNLYSMKHEHGQNTTSRT